MKFAVAVLGAVVAIAVGCGTQSTTGPTPSPTSPPKVPSLIDARWMGFARTEPWNWEDADRRVTKDFQQFGFRPVGESELPHGCNGCGVAPATARVTVYSPGTFDPADARTGQPVSGAGDDAFFRAGGESQDAILTWQYAQNAWATVRGTTTATSDVDRMLELARALRPTERTPIRVPMSLANVPANMPLAQVDVETGPYGTTLTFAACVKTDVAPECVDNSDHLRVQMWRDDSYAGHIDERDAVAWTIGGKDGRYDKASNTAAVQVGPGMLVVFELSGPYPAPPATRLEDILASVVWAPDPGDESTWPAVTDWTK